MDVELVLSADCLGKQEEKNLTIYALFINRFLLLLFIYVSKICYETIPCLFRNIN